MLDRARIDAHLTRFRAQNKTLRVKWVSIDWRQSQVIQLVQRQNFERSSKDPASGQKHY
jgi:hypothetical protein